MSPGISFDFEVTFLLAPEGMTDPVSSQLLRRLRLHLGLTAERAARALSMTEIEYAALEAGRRAFADDGAWDAAAERLQAAARR